MCKKSKLLYFDSSYKSGASKLFILVWCSCCYHCHKTLDWLRSLWLYMPLSAFPSGWTGCSVKICQLSWLQTYREASFTLAGFSWTKYANLYIGKIEKNVTSCSEVYGGIITVPASLLVNRLSLCVFFFSLWTLVNWVFMRTFVHQVSSHEQIKS